MNVSNLNAVVNLILADYFLSSRCLFLLTDKTNSDLLITVEIPIVNIKIVDGRIQEDLIFNNFGCKDIIIKSEFPVSSFASFEASIRNETNTVERFNDRRYLILEGHESIENLSDIYHLNQLEHLADFLVVESEKRPAKRQNNNYGGFKMEYFEDVFIFSTHRFVGNDQVKEKTVLDIWSSYDQHFLYNASLFPDKISNLEGKIVKLSSFMYQPYSVYGKCDG